MITRWIYQYQCKDQDCKYEIMQMLLIFLITLLLPCMLAMVEVTGKDKGEDDKDEQKNDENDVKLHRRYSGSHHRF